MLFLMLICLALPAWLLGCGDYTIHVAPPSEGDDPGECSDLADNDENGLFDCDDEGCVGALECLEGPDAPGTCDDGIDNDRDQLLDCEDDGCLEAPECRQNIPPTAPELVIDPIGPTTADTLACSIVVNSHDADGDEIEYSVAWTVDGVDAGIEGFTVDSELTTRGEVWACSVTPSDGLNDGDSGTIAVTIDNYVPTEPVVAILPGYPTDRDDLECQVVVPSSDEDGDPLTYQYVWSRGTLQPDGSVSWQASGITGNVVPWVETAAYDSWLCTVVPSDGITTGPEAGAEVQVVVDGTQFVAAGRYHGCAVRQDGLVACWGVDDSSAMDSGQVTGSMQPQYGAGEVVAGEFFGCILKYDTASVHCWGHDDDQQVSGIPLGTFIQVSAGTRHVCGVRSNGRLECWGAALSWNEQPPSGIALEVASGEDFSCARMEDTSLVCWNMPTGVQPPAGTGWTQIAAGGGHACALDGAGAVSCWGDDSLGQGQSGVDALGGLAFEQLSAGQQHSCGVERGTGFAHCWGDDSFGQSSVAGGVFEQVSAGWNHTCGRRTNLVTVECWGCGSGEDRGQCSPVGLSP
ncbi:MAG: hypothetical protein CMP23_00545 [Rickettsiales bacterium]|nr:hypothetical protein [Rickettsiales bacterium]